MNTRVLQYILSVNSFRNFHAAAKECGVSQPALSTAIKAFEKEIGSRIFIRTTRKVIISNVGEKIINQIKIINGEILALKEIIDYKSSHQKLPIRIATDSSIAANQIPKLTKSLSERVPNTNIQVYEESQVTAINKLVNNLIDVAIIPGKISHVPSLIHERIISEPIMLCATPDHRIFSEKNITNENLLEQNIIMAKDHPSIYDAVNNYLELKLNLNNCLKTRSINGVTLMLNAKMGIGFLPESIAQQLLGLGLKYKFLSKNLQRDINIVWRANEPRTDIIGHIRRIMTHTNPSTYN